MSVYWLVSIDNSFVTVAIGENIGIKSVWEYPQVDSFLTAVDTSLSSASEKANLSSETEPSTAAFIIPHNWIGDDGKIVSENKKLIEQVCQKLTLKPLGFITHDEAIVEDSSSEEGLPVSFLLLYLTPSFFDLSFVYLGKIKQYIHQPFSAAFSPEILETTLASIENDSALPPKVFIIGTFESTLINDLKNYAWIGKRNIETFLHFPDFKAIKDPELVEIYHRVINRQFEPEKTSTESFSKPEVNEDIIASPKLVEVSPDELGFEYDNLPVLETKSIVEPEIINTFPKPQISLPKLPKINFKFKLPSFRFLFLLPALSPLIIIFFVFYYKIDLSLAFTPFEFSQTIEVALSPSATEIIDTNIIPVTEKNFDVKLNISTPATGTKIVGEKSKGQIIIFNKLDKVQNIPKGSVLQNSNGLKYITSTAVQVASSTINLDAGIITMGQTKATVEAFEIGPEYDLSKDTKLDFKDSSFANMQAKVETKLSGGSKNEVLVIASADKQKLESQISGSIAAKVEEKIKSEVSSLSGLLKETIIIKKNRAEYSREIGEEADTLSVNSDNSILAYTLSSTTKKEIVTDLISQKPEYDQTNFNIDQFTFSFTPTSSDKLKGKMTIIGKLNPAPDTSTIRHDLVAKTPKYLSTYIPNKYSRVYNYKISSNLNFLTKIILPIRWQNISIITK